ncbi:hypothetical protein ABT317_44090, partial [Streptomyces carpinensis]
SRPMRPRNTGAVEVVGRAACGVMDMCLPGTGAWTYARGKSAAEGCATEAVRGEAHRMGAAGRGA